MYLYFVVFGPLELTKTLLTGTEWSLTGVHVDPTAHSCVDWTINTWFLFQLVVVLEDLNKGESEGEQGNQETANKPQYMCITPTNHSTRVSRKGFAAGGTTVGQKLG